MALKFKRASPARRHTAACGKSGVSERVQARALALQARTQKAWPRAVCAVGMVEAYLDVQHQVNDDETHTSPSSTLPLNMRKRWEVDMA